MFWDTIQSKKKKERFLLSFSFKKGIKKKRIQNAIKINKKKIKNFSNPTKKGKIFIYIYFVSFWRHGRVVRRGTANPFSPVQIWVSPDQQKTRNLLFGSADITLLLRKLAQLFSTFEMLLPILFCLLCLIFPDSNRNFF